MLKKFIINMLLMLVLTDSSVMASTCDPRSPQVNPGFKLATRRVVKGEQLILNLGLLSTSNKLRTALFLAQSIWPAIGINYKGLTNAGLALHAYMSDGHTACDPDHLCYVWLTGIVAKTAKSTAVSIHAFSKTFAACEAQFQQLTLIVNK